MAKKEQPPETPYLLPNGRWDIPNIPAGEVTPCMNEDVAGAKVDLWFSEGYGRQRADDAAREAASICNTVCRLQNPDAYAACRAYAEEFKPRYGVWGGLLPPGVVGFDNNGEGGTA